MHAKRSAIADPGRIAAVRETALLDGPPDESLERLTRLASRLVRAPTIRMTLIDDHREFVVSGTGLREPLASTRAVPLAESFCQHVVASASPVVIADARRSSRYRGNAAVRQRGELAYAGFPIQDAGGYVLGAFCAVDYQPRGWDETDLETLRDFATSASGEIDRRVLLRSRDDVRNIQEMAGEMRLTAASFRGLVDQSLVGIYVVQGGRFRYVNPHFAEIFGYSVAEITALDTPLTLVAEEDRDHVARAFEPLLKGEAPDVGFSFRGKRKDGVALEMEVQGSRTDFEGRAAVVGTLLDITQRRRAEAALRESEERYRRFFEDDLAGVYTARVDGRILDCNPSFLRIFGFDDVNEALRSNIVERYHAPEEREAMLAQLRVQRRLELYELNLRRRDGTPVHVSENLVGIFDGDGELTAIRGYVLDITERQRAVESLRESEEKLRSILEMAHDAFVAIDARGQITDWNAQAEKTFGWSRAEAVGRPLSALMIPARYRDAHEAGMHRFIATGEGKVVNRRFEMPALHRDGHEFPLELTITPVQLNSGYIFTSFLHDISERKQTESALRESEERLRLVERATNDVIWDWDLVSGRLLWNEAGPKRFRYARGEVVASVEWHVERIHPEDREQVVSGIHAVMSGVDDAWAEEYRFLRGDGSYATVLDRAYVVRNERGEPTRMIGSMMDVSERKRVEETQRFLARASTLLDISLDAEITLTSLARLCVPGLADYCLIDLVEEDGSITRVAQAHVDPIRERLLLTGERHGPEADPERHPVIKVARTAEAVLVPELTGAVLQAIAHDTEHREGLRKLGLRSFMIVPIVARERVLGTITFASAESGRHYQPIDLMVAQDLAHRAALCIDNAQLYMKVRDAVRARDEVLGVVSHDLRNPLSTIVTSVGLLLETDGQQDSHPRKWLEVARRAAEQMNVMIDDLLDVTSIEAGRFSLKRADREVASVVGDAYELLQPLAAAKDIRLERRVSGDLPTVSIDSSQILRALSNLVGNAIKFTPAGGSIMLGAERVEGDVRLSVSDTGPGIPTEDVARVFDRFWQAQKGDRRGAGLGLAIARGIVEAHGGRIWVESTPGHGATFYLTIPADEGGSRDPAHPDRYAPSQAGTALPWARTGRSRKVPPARLGSDVPAPNRTGRQN